MIHSLHCMHSFMKPIQALTSPKLSSSAFCFQKTFSTTQRSPLSRTLLTKAIVTSDSHQQQLLDEYFQFIGLKTEKETSSLQHVSLDQSISDMVKERAKDLKENQYDKSNASHASRLIRQEGASKTASFISSIKEINKKWTGHCTVSSLFKIDPNSLRWNDHSCSFSRKRHRNRTSWRVRQ